MIETVRADDIHADHLTQHDGYISVGTNDAADRCSNISRRQPGGCYLIEQRLEQVIVLPVNNDDLYRGISKSSSRP